MVNIHSTDYIGHRFGPESKEMDACLKAVDENLGELLQKMEQAGILENTAVIVTADHGMTSSNKAIPLNALSIMHFPDAGAVIDGRNGYIWYGKEDREAVIRFFNNIEGIRNVFERESEETDLQLIFVSNQNSRLKNKDKHNCLFLFFYAITVSTMHSMYISLEDRLAVW